MSAHFPVVLLHERSQSELSAKALEEGADASIQMPLDIRSAAGTPFPDMSATAIKQLSSSPITKSYRSPLTYRAGVAAAAKAKPSIER